MEVKELLRFLDNSKSCFHAIKEVTKKLEENGFEALYENEDWQLKEKGKYYVVRNDSSVIAFKVPHDPQGFLIAASHSDSPTLKLKENPEIKKAGYTMLNVEKYGGAILSGWFDRPLSIAGRVFVKDGGKIVFKLVDVDEDLLVIPSLAIHMDRSVNDNHSINVQNDMCPIISLDEEGSVMDVVAKYAGCKKEDILGHDLFLYVRDEGRVVGMHHDIVMASRLDDLQCGFADLHGFLNASLSTHIPLLAIFNNEETGSLSYQGADSTFLKDTMDRILTSLHIQNSQKLYANAMMISADNAHALHPMHLDKADPINRPHINKGIVIKYNANQKYTSDALSSSLFKSLCQKVDVPYQTFTNRSDMVGGSTLGNLSNRHVSLPTVDIGLPQLAMHACVETAGWQDTLDLIKVMEAFFSAAFHREKDSYSL